MPFNVSRFRKIVDEIENSTCGLVLKQEVRELSKNINKVEKFATMNKLKKALHLYDGQIKITDRMLIEDLLIVLNDL